MDIIVTLTNEEFEILESWLGIGMIQPWLQHAIDNKLRKRVDASILEHTDKNPAKLTLDEKLIILESIQLPTKEERDKPFKIGKEK